MTYVISPHHYRLLAILSGPATVQLASPKLLLRMAPLRDDKFPQVKVDNDSAEGAGNEITETSVMQSMLELGQEARRVLQGTMKAFANRDFKAARYLREEDDVVDVRYHLVRHDLMAMMTGARAIPALQNDCNDPATFHLLVMDCAQVGARLRSLYKHL